MKDHKITLDTIYNTVKHSLIKGVKPKDLLKDPEATAWQYAHTLTPFIKGAYTARKFKEYNNVFLDHYYKALKGLNHAK